MSDTLTRSRASVFPGDARARAPVSCLQPASDVIYYTRTQECVHECLNGMELRATRGDAQLLLLQRHGCFAVSVRRGSQT